MPADTGGPAFPRVANGGPGYWSAVEGMTLRDYFAAACLASLANGNNLPNIATKCYALADAMMVERAKP